MKLWLRANIFHVLDIFKFLGILILLLMFIHFSLVVSRNTALTRQSTNNTNQIVKSQTEILAAIKQVTLDTQLTAQQQTNIIICMLQVPVEQRTTDLEANCRASVQPTTLQPNQTTPPSPAPPSSEPAKSSTPSSPPTPTPSPSPCRVKVLSVCLSS